MASTQTDGVNGNHKGHCVQAVLHDIESLNGESFADEGERSKALLAAYALVARLETPWEFVARFCMGQPALASALKVCKDLQLFDKWHEQYGDGELSSDKLAEIVGCDPALLVRLLRHLAANHLLLESSIGTYMPTRFSLAFLQPVFGEWINHLYDATLPLALTTPSYLQKTSYITPLNPRNGIFQAAKSCQGSDAFDYFASHPREGESFNHVMGGVMAHQISWLDIYPSQNLLEDTANSIVAQKVVNKNGRVEEDAVNGEEEKAVLVDVGGNVGHDMQRFYNAHPEAARRCYLQDRPEVVKLSQVPDPVRKMGYDFFTPQPVQGAKAYYMHGVLHDWPDAFALRILENQKSAMTPGYSRLLIHDHIIGRALDQPHATAYDLTMMGMVAGKERTEGDWQDLVGRAGMRIGRVWRSEGAVQGILEVVVVGV
ncbi:hypothetical protein N7G274_007532 [Stereocaulon virgatum]|uniref:S-adenosyl-L-methionine-dependent methyltransferase n=1 Tax=Stereocaulon virgatum TaxID=373712 RepID=A0ABR4A212_9LECA